MESSELRGCNSAGFELYRRRSGSQADAPMGKPRVPDSAPTAAPKQAPDDPLNLRPDREQKCKQAKQELVGLEIQSDPSLMDAAYLRQWEKIPKGKEKQVDDYLEISVQVVYLCGLAALSDHDIGKADAYMQELATAEGTWFTWVMKAHADDLERLRDRYNRLVDNYNQLLANYKELSKASGDYEAATERLLNSSAPSPILVPLAPLPPLAQELHCNTQFSGTSAYTNCY